MIGVTHLYHCGASSNTTVLLCLICTSEAPSTLQATLSIVKPEYDPKCIFRYMTIRPFCPYTGDNFKYLATFLNATFSTFQFPAYSAAVTQLVPKSQFGRVSGLMQLGDAIGQLLALLLTAGPLADRIFSPLLTEGGLLAAMFTALGGFAYPRLRKVEEELPDAPAD